jgi:hypothetical protein
VIAKEKLMQIKLMTLLLTLMVFTGCNKDLNFNPTTTILKHIMKGEKK